jgi:hypothetical protein
MTRPADRSMPHCSSSATPSPTPNPSQRPTPKQNCSSISQPDPPALPVRLNRPHRRPLPLPRIHLLHQHQRRKTSPPQPPATHVTPRSQRPRQLPAPTPHLRKEYSGSSARLQDPLPHRARKIKKISLSVSSTRNPAHNAATAPRSGRNNGGNNLRA